MVLGRQAFRIVGLAIGVALIPLALLAAPAWAQPTTLTVDKTGNPNTVEEGDTVTYTIVVTNSGNATASEVTLVDDLPNRFDYVDFDFESAGSSNRGDCSLGPAGDSTSDVTCDLGNLGADGRATVTIDVRVAGTGTFTNRVTADSIDAEQVTDTVDTAVRDGNDNDNNRAGEDQYDNNANDDNDADEDDDRKDVINVPGKDLPDTGGPPLLGVAFFVLAGAGLLTAVVRRRY